MAKQVTREQAERKRQQAEIACRLGSGMNTSITKVVDGRNGIDQPAEGKVSGL